MPQKTSWNLRLVDRFMGCLLHWIIPILLIDYCWGYKYGLLKDFPLFTRFLETLNVFFFSVKENHGLRWNQAMRRLETDEIKSLGSKNPSFLKGSYQPNQLPCPKKDGRREVLNPGYFWSGLVFKIFMTNLMSPSFLRGYGVPGWEVESDGLGLSWSQSWWLKS